MPVIDLYLRKSTADQGRSVARQGSECLDAVATLGATLGRTFTDDGISASRHATKVRTDWPALLAHIRSGACEMIMFWESARGSRVGEEWLGFLSLCRQHKVLIHIVTDGRTYDMRLRRDWRTLADDGIDAEDESEKIRERVLSGKRKAASEGRPAGTLTYGYTREYDERGKLVRQYEHPETGPIIREICDRIKSGLESDYAIERDLDRRGITAPQGGTWARSGHLTRLILNPAYLGKRVHQGQGNVVGDAAWPAILDPDDVAAIRARLAEPRRNRSHGTEMAYPLPGLIPCGALCGGTLRTGANNGKRVYICDCRKSVLDGESVDRLVVDSLLLRVDQMTPEQRVKLFAPESNDAASVKARADVRAIKVELSEWRSLAGTPNAPSPMMLADAEQRVLKRLRTAEGVLAKLETPAPLAHLVGVDFRAEFQRWPARIRREVIGHLVEFAPPKPAIRGRNRFDPWRLAESRWRGDTKTWGEHWTAEGL